MSDEAFLKKNSLGQRTTGEPQNFNGYQFKETPKLLDGAEHEAEDEYKKFITNHGSKWRIFNLISMLLFLGIAGETIAMQRFYPEDCDTIKTALWLSMVCNFLNALVNFLCMLSIE